jgi:hypothetical protein
MSGQMDESYYEEKKALSEQSLKAAIQQIESAAGLIESSRYSMPALIDANQVHDTLKYAAVLIESARRDFEKAKWASAKTNQEFDEWLRASGASELAEPKKQSIKEASTESIERAMASAVSDLLGEKYKATISKIDFTHHNQLGAIAIVPIELNVSLANKFPGAI